MKLYHGSNLKATDINLEMSQYKNRHSLFFTPITSQLSEAKSRFGT